MIVVRDGDGRELDELFSRSGLVAGGDDVVLVAVDTATDEVVGGLTGALSTDYSEHLAEHVAPPQAYLGKIAVGSQDRRAGAGRALLGEFARRGLAAGSTQLIAVIDGHEDNGRRVAFFHSCACRSLDTSATSPNSAVAGYLEEVVAACGEG